MKYAYANLGVQKKGSVAVFKIRGGAANVMLLDVPNFVRFEHERSFHFIGGRYRGSPVRLEVPEDGPWYAVVEFGTYNGRAKASVEMLAADGSTSADESDRVLIEA